MNKLNLTSRKIEDLNPVFAEKVKELLENCKKRGYTLVPYVTFRGPLAQARLYTRGRSKERYAKDLASLHRQNADFIGKLLRAAGYSFDTKIVTNAYPGQSWHQYGLAVDCYVEDPITKKSIWSGKGYEVYAEEAKKLGLTSGHYWKMRDSVHVQLPSDLKPSGTLAAISADLQRTYGSEFLASFPGI